LAIDHYQALDQQLDAACDGISVGSHANGYLSRWLAGSSDLLRSWGAIGFRRRRLPSYPAMHRRNGQASA
jgi:hypothetical protein